MIKFKTGVYGFIYDSSDGYITKIFTEPLTNQEINSAHKFLGEDDMIFVVDDEEDIVEAWELAEYPDTDLDESGLGDVIEWAKN